MSDDRCPGCDGLHLTPHGVVACTAAALSSERAARTAATEALDAAYHYTLYPPRSTDTGGRPLCRECFTPGTDQHSPTCRFGLLLAAVTRARRALAAVTKDEE